MEGGAQKLTRVRPLGLALLLLVPPAVVLGIVFLYLVELPPVLAALGFWVGLRDGERSFRITWTVVGFVIMVAAMAIFTLLRAWET